MTDELWQRILLPPGNDDEVWELFHENSKIGRHSYAFPIEEVREKAREFHESLPYETYPSISLPSPLSAFQMPLEKAILGRVSVRHFEPHTLNLESLATLLHYAYGVNRVSEDSTLARPCRVVPSGGALYPLEIYLHSTRIEGQAEGLYHYNPSTNSLQLLHQEDGTDLIAQTVVQPQIVLGATIVLFITGVFNRAIFKYGDRGYRFTLLEAGHVAQNLNLVSQCLDLGCLNIGGFFDREVDDYLGIDGLTHSTIYMMAIGKVREFKGPEEGNPRFLP
ncbi:MAG: SagB/ThcOx family dehydrogenase [Nitrospira sp. CR1.3]|nr:SagB/ThcOx family dehydrogenase [Nitrospira sp. CR1.3]